MTALLFASPLVLFYSFDMVDQDNVKTPFCSLSSDPTYQLWYSVYNCVRQSLTNNTDIGGKEGGFENFGKDKPGGHWFVKKIKVIAASSWYLS